MVLSRILCLHHAYTGACGPRPSSWQPASSQRSQLRRASDSLEPGRGEEVWRWTPQCSSFIGIIPDRLAALGLGWWIWVRPIRRSGSAGAAVGSSERGDEIDWGSKMRCQPGSSHTRLVFRLKSAGWWCPRLRRRNTRGAGRIARSKMGTTHLAPSLLRWSSSFQKLAGCAACEAITL